MAKFEKKSGSKDKDERDRGSDKKKFAGFKDKKKSFGKDGPSFSDKKKGKKDFDKGSRRKWDKDRDDARPPREQKDRYESDALLNKTFGDFSKFYLKKEVKPPERKEKDERKFDKPERKRFREDEKKDGGFGKRPFSKKDQWDRKDKKDRSDDRKFSPKSEKFDRNEDQDDVSFKDILASVKGGGKKKFNDRDSKKEQKSDEKSILRLNKYIAKAGICARRKAAELVKEGKVKVNGKVEINPAYEIQNNDVIEYDGKVLSLEEKLVYFLLNKPKGYITTMDDEKGRRTVMDLMEGKTDLRIYPVGRLDRNTTGLLLLTNDGEMAKKLSHPSHNVKKIYHVVLDKNVSLADIEKIKNGLTLEDGPIEVDAVGYVDGAAKNEVGVEIHSGRNRIVRRIFEHLGYQVDKLDRTYFGGLTKKDLPRGWSRPLSEQEIVMVKHFL